MASFVPNTKEQQKTMLDAIGVSSIDELFSDIPAQVRLKDYVDIPAGVSELETAKIVKSYANANTVFQTILRGAGAYNHFIPSAVTHMASREEFVSAYTPYQAEISQGVLQAIFEFQTMICELTGMDVANASVYDGATAAAEAIAICRDRNRNKVLLSAAAHPDFLTVINTYATSTGAEIVMIPTKDGKTDLEALASLLDKNTACVYTASPNYFGQMEDGAKIAELTHAVGAKYIASCNPISLGLFQTPGEFGADIAVGEGQPLGMPLSFGGPYLGFMAAKQQFMRKLPGRITGQTVDKEGNRMFVLTLQAREQHIRREKASSSICSNEALCALTAGAYLSAVGPNGLHEIASQCYSKAHYAAKAFSAVPGFELVYTGEFFHEFVTACPVDPQVVMAKLQAEGILGGLVLDNGNILWCVTELVSKQEIDHVAALLKEVAGK